MDSDKPIEIDTQSPYHWKPEYLPLWQGLQKARATRELTKEEMKMLEWFSYGLTNSLFKGMM